MYRHRPTDCNNKKALEKVVMAEDIDNAIRWYDSHWQEIAFLLPVTFEGVTYSTKFQHRMDWQIWRWQMGLTSLCIGRASIYAAIAKIWRALVRS